MIFLITAARKKRERTERARERGREMKRNEEGRENIDGDGGGRGASRERLLHLAVSTPYSSEPAARPSSTRVQPRRPRGFSHKKY